jgi:predicted NodU family carbamoyl transferase
LLNADPVGIRLAPVVDTAADAVRTFRSIGLDFLVLGSHLVEPGK